MMKVINGIKRAIKIGEYLKAVVDILKYSADRLEQVSQVKNNKKELRDEMD